MVRPEIRRAKLLEKIRTIEVKYSSINYLKSQSNLYRAEKKAKRRKTSIDLQSLKSYYNDFHSYTSAKKSLEKLNNDVNSNISPTDVAGFDKAVAGNTRLNNIQRNINFDVYVPRRGNDDVSTITDESINMQRERERFGREHPTDLDRDEIDENNSNNENSEYNIVLCEKKIFSHFTSYIKTVPGQYNKFLISHRILILSRDNVIFSHFTLHIKTVPGHIKIIILRIVYLHFFFYD